MIDPSKPFDLEHTVGESWENMRLDRYVQRMVPTISRTRIQQYNAEGRIFVNGRIRAHNWKVRAGDTVLLRCRVPEGGTEAAKAIPVRIVYEDEWLLAVNKQSGLVVHPVALHRHDTLMNALYFRYRDTLPPGKELSLVNRIDKLTSGVVMVSKDVRAKRNLQEQFEARSVYKTYLALVRGIVENDQGEVNLPIGPKENRANRVLMDVRRDAAGKPSLSRFWTLERFPAAGETGFSLVRVAPRTGRQHQIRVHMTALGHPLAADHLYGHGQGLSAARARLERFALHAESLTVTHPIEKRELRVTAPLEGDFAGILAALRKGGPVERFPLAGGDAEDDADPDDVNETETRYSRTPPGEHEFDSL